MSIIVFYDEKANIVLNVGSSEPKAHSVLYSKHAEDFALNDIKKYLSRFGRKKLKHITIVIWKQNREGILKSINCCGWCKKSVLKCGLNNNQIITPIVEDGIWNGEFKSSIVECSKRPVLLMKNKL